MKNIKSFDNFLNEGLSVSKGKIQGIKSLMELAKTKDVDVAEFVEKFAQTYNSACEMWLDEDKCKELLKLFLTGKYEFICLGGESKDGSSDSKYDQYVDKGWKLLDDDQNDDSYDAIFYKKK